jgi:hypothetical protein
VAASHREILTGEGTIEWVSYDLYDFISLQFIHPKGRLWIVILVDEASRVKNSLANYSLKCPSLINMFGHAVTGGYSSNKLKVLTEERVSTSREGVKSNSVSV